MSLPLALRAVACAAACLALATCTGGAKPRARAQRIGKLEQAIGGPHAIGRVGDFILENDQVRFVIADTGRCPAPKRNDCIETYGRVNTTFGGSLVDADLVRVGDNAGNDQLAELLPGVFFTVIDPTEVKVTDDGSDGSAAEVTVIGTGGDLFQMVALLNTGLVFPQSLELRQVYRLEPGKKYVTIETTIKNSGPGAHPFPYLNPQELDDLLGQNIPGIDQLELSVPLGLMPLFGGEQSLFTPGVAGFNVRFAIEDSYLTAGGFPSLPGMAVDFVATKGPGVSYGLTIPESPDNFVNAYPDGYAGQEITKYSMLLPFTYAGVTAAYMYRTPPVLQANEERTYTSYFIVGDGDVGSVLDTILELRQVATGSFGGRVVDELTGEPIANANVILTKPDGKIYTQLGTDDGGSFLGSVEPGDYEYLVVTDDRPRSTPKQITIAANEKVGRLLQMAPPATLAVSVVDELGRRAPAKIQLLGKDDRVAAIDGRNILYSLQLGEDVRPTSSDGTGRYVERAWWTIDGRLSANVRPGTYELVVSRGPEYELTSKTVTLEAGKLTGEQLQLTRAFDTPGWVSGDFHIHAQPSTDSGLPIDERVASCAAEGLEIAVATDHNFITDYTPVIASSGLDQWLLGISGMELTTFEAGHFIGFPLEVDAGSTRGGEFTWAHQPPATLFDQLRNLSVSGEDSVVQVAHPRQQVLGYFSQYFVDVASGEPYTPTGIIGVFAPYGDEFQKENFSYAFDSLELLTANKLEDVHTFRAPDPLPPGPFPDPQPVPGEVVVGNDGKPTFPGTVETWFTLLDRGHKATGIGASDTHHLIGDEPGYARTLLYVGEGRDVPGAFSRQDVVRATREHHAITTNAPFVDVRIGEARIGDTLSDTRAQVPVEITVRAPSWAKVDTLIVYMNSAVVQTIPIPDGTSFTTTVMVSPTVDSWVVAEVTGMTNMFPVVSPVEFPPLDATIIIGALSAGLDLGSLPIASALKPQRLHTATPYAITNPIWIDHDGNGTWNPPKPPLPAAAPAPSSRPDVRQQFDALPEISR